MHWRWLLLSTSALSDGTHEHCRNDGYSHAHIIDIFFSVPRYHLRARTCQNEEHGIRVISVRLEEQPQLGTLVWEGSMGPYQD